MKNDQSLTMNSQLSSPLSSIPQGYKQTEVGVIPEDWKISILGNCVSFKTGPFGSLLHKSDYIEGGIPVINPMQINDGKIEPTISMSITEVAAQKLSNFLLHAGDIVIGRRGEMGRCAYVRREQAGWLCGSGSMIVKVSANINAQFIQRFLSSPAAINAITNASVGSTMINLNQSALSNLIIALPPTIAEQEAIATTLSDTDALIESLEQLIAKKRQIKQGAMQELLTGKRRLPGFGDIWVVKNLGDICQKITTGKLDANMMNENGTYPFFTCAKEHYWINEYAFDDEVLLVSGNGANVGYVHYYKGKFNAYQRTYSSSHKR